MPQEPSPPDPETREQLARTLSQLSELRTENKLLREKIEALVRKLYDASSEQLDRAQLLLMLQGLAAPPGKEPEPVGAKASRRSTGQSPPCERGPRIPAHLPVVEEVIDPEPVKP